MAVNLLPGIVKGSSKRHSELFFFFFGGGDFFFSYVPRLPPCNYLRGPESKHHHFKMLPADSWTGSEVCCFNLSSKILGKWKPCGEASSSAVGKE